MGINVTADFTNFDKKFSDQNLVRARLAFANDAHQAMEPTVPKKVGDLRSYSFVNSDGSAVVYTQPYARVQFLGLIDGKYPIAKYTTPGTGPRWDQKFVADSQKLSKAKQAFVNGGGFV